MPYFDFLGVEAEWQWFNENSEKTRLNEKGETAFTATALATPPAPTSAVVFRNFLRVDCNSPLTVIHRLSSVHMTPCVKLRPR